MAAINMPSPDSGGVTGDGTADYRINNDYLWPRYTVPPFMRPRNFTATPGGSVSTSPYRNPGLLRGWIYPIDVNTTDYLSAVGATSTNGMDDAVNRAIAEKAKADAAAAATATDEEEETVATAHPPAGPSTVVLANGEPAWLPKKIRYREGKQFQFNPFFVEVAIEMTSAAPAETQQQGGTAGTEQIGGATTSLQLLFDRSMETYAATMGVDKVDAYTIDPIFADIGVQKDLWDVYRILLGGDKDYFKNVGKKLVNIDDVAGVGGMKVQPGSVTDMTTRLFDLGISGASAWGRRVAVFYNPNLVIIGDVTSIGFVYAEFNANYVPIKAKLDLGLSILHTTSESGANTFVGADDTSTDTQGTEGADGVNGTADDVPLSYDRNTEANRPTYSTGAGGRNYTV